MINGNDYIKDGLPDIDLFSERLDLSHRKNIYTQKSLPDYKFEKLNEVLARLDLQYRIKKIPFSIKDDFALE